MNEPGVNMMNAAFNISERAAAHLSNIHHTWHEARCTPDLDFLLSKHVQFLRHCIKTLPQQATSADSSRCVSMFACTGYGLPTIPKMRFVIELIKNIPKILIFKILIIILLQKEILNYPWLWAKNTYFSRQFFFIDIMKIATNCSRWIWLIAIFHVSIYTTAASWHVSQSKMKKKIANSGIIDSEDVQNGKFCYLVEFKSLKQFCNYEFSDWVVQLSCNFNENVHCCRIICR